MFVRMLKLPRGGAARYDLSRHQVAVHAAAPCPVEVKRQMIDWWGPIIHEYYAGTEGTGATIITATTGWRTRARSGAPAWLGILHICDDDGDRAAAGRERA